MADLHRFHRRCGENIVFSNDGRTARRQGSYGYTFFNSVVFSQQPLRDGEIFEVKFDEEVSMMKSGSGSALVLHAWCLRVLTHCTTKY